MGTDFTERCHAFFNLVVDYLLCSLHVRPVGLLLCKGYLLELQYFRKFHSQSSMKTRRLNTYQSNLISRSAGVTNRSIAVTFLWSLFIPVSY